MTQIRFIKGNSLNLSSQNNDKNNDKLPKLNSIVHIECFKSIIGYIQWCYDVKDLMYYLNWIFGKNLIDKQVTKYIIKKRIYVVFNTNLIRKNEMNKANKLYLILSKGINSKKYYIRQSYLVYNICNTYIIYAYIFCMYKLIKKKYFIYLN